jgi:hypothetical protein
MTTYLAAGHASARAIPIALWVSAIFWMRAPHAEIGVPASCDDPPFLKALHDAERQVDSLRIDKGGGARVFAADGTEFTAGQSMWMKGQLRDVEQACKRKDLVEATRQLNGVITLLKAHAHRE